MTARLIMQSSSARTIPNYKKDDGVLPDDEPQNNDQRFSYYTNVTRWNTCPFTSEADMLVCFPSTQEQANEAVSTEKQPGKGAKGDNPLYLLIQILQGQSSPRKRLMQPRPKDRILMQRDDRVPSPKAS